MSFESERENIFKKILFVLKLGDKLQNLISWKFLESEQVVNNLMI